MNLLIVKFRTAFQLGLSNLVLVVKYRLGVKTGLNPVRRIVASIPQGVYFEESENKIWPSLPVSGGWSKDFLLFGHRRITITASPPDWHANILTGNRFRHPRIDWWKIPDFDPHVGDIKLVWELSRFEWALAFSQQTVAGKPDALKHLNSWLNDWVENNPPYKGVNWKCGQEASIRVMHLAMVAILLDQFSKPTTVLIALIEAHLQRIEPTIGYAIAQNNNHGTSEAAALFIGGSWVANHGVKKGGEWARIGRKWLENRASKLIEEDGSFSQYSVNYHRVLLDTLSMVEIWRQKNNLSPFSNRWYTRSGLAAEWLRTIVNPINGDAPNIGANDGAHLLHLTTTGYRDFRPSVQLAMALFNGRRAYTGSDNCDSQLKWFGIELPAESASKLTSIQFDDGGYAILRKNRAMAVLRYPRFRYRPSHADCLHLDFWIDERNVFRDAGTFSYNSKQEHLKYFPGTQSHNTIQFDNRDQMPRLSRFLFGDWLNTKFCKPLHYCSESRSVSFAAGYVDRQNAKHFRSTELGDNVLRIVDEVSGFKSSAILRWRLEPGDWAIEGYCIRSELINLSVSFDGVIDRFEIVDALESRYYQQKSTIPVLEVEVSQPGTIVTECTWE